KRDWSSDVCSSDLIGGFVTPTIAYLQSHTQLGIAGNGANQVLWIDDLDAVIAHDVIRGHVTRTFLNQFQRGFITVFHPQGNPFEVEEDVDDIFLNALDGRVFVLYAVDLHFGDRASGHAGQQ